MEVIRFNNLSYTYRNGSSPALKELTFKVAEGETLGVIGLNGSGKTTLSYCLCGIIPHYLHGTMTGDVIINGKNTRDIPLHQLTGDIGIVLQDPNIQLLMPTVEDDIAFGLENHNLPREKIAERIEHALSITGTQGLRQKNPNRLSGGEKQLVALATVLALNPSIIIFDESLSMLDSRATEQVMRVMLRLKENGTTMVIIDHTGKGSRVYDKVFVLEDGRIVHRGPRDRVLNDRQFLREHRLISSFEQPCKSLPEV